MELSVVVPVYNEEENIPVFVDRVMEIVSGITQEFEIIFSMDPGRDHTEEVILERRRSDPRVKLLKFSRRVGQPMATLAGMQYSKGRAVVVIDADLQDPPELVAQMLALWREGFDVVTAQRRSRAGETAIKKLVAHVGYKIINRIAEVKIPPNTGDFRLMSRRVVDEVCRLKECHGFLRGLVALVGFRQALIQFDRPPRHSGKGNYNPFFGSLRIGFNGFFCFSNYMLTLSTQMGLIVAGLSFLVAFCYLIAKLLGFPFPIGNPTIVILVLFLGGCQLLSIGILGEYLGRIYDEVRQRPKFIIDAMFGFDELTTVVPAAVNGTAVVDSSSRIVANEIER
jgi:polyisoprenyl-phosphate glycosyltransferase